MKLNTREFAEKFIPIERRLAIENGAFTFFALIRAKTKPELWDLVVSAPWLTTEGIEGYRTISQPVTDTLTLRDLIYLSRVVILKTDDPFIASVQSLADGFEGQITELPGLILRETIIPDSYLITSHRPASKSPQLSESAAGRPTF